MRFTHSSAASLAPDASACSIAQQDEAPAFTTSTLSSARPWAAKAGANGSKGGEISVHQRASGSRVRCARAGKKQIELPDSQPRHENFDQTGCRPAATGQALIERGKARRNGADARGAATAPYGGMLEQPRKRKAGGHGCDTR